MRFSDKFLHISFGYSPKEIENPSIETNETPQNHTFVSNNAKWIMFNKKSFFLRIKSKKTDKMVF